jgi:hypothetical protein
MKIFSGYVKGTLSFRQTPVTFEAEDVSDIAQDDFMEIMNCTVVKSEFSTVSVTLF